MRARIVRGKSGLPWGRGSFRRIRVAAFLVATFLPMPVLSAECEPGDQQCLLEAKRNHLVMQAEYWIEEPAAELADRVMPAPPEIIEYLILDNQLWELDLIPEPAVYDAAFEEDLRKAIETMPPEVVALVTERLVGIFLVEDLGGTAMTERINNPLIPGSGYITLDAKAIDRKANEWKTWKESSVFEPDGPYVLDAIIADDASDTRANAIQYILLHEFAHIISIDSDIHPNWSLDDGRWPPKPGDFDFFDLSWEVSSDGLLISKYKLRYPILLYIPFYFATPKTANDKMVEFFDALEKTNFPTPYAGVGFSDDFADSFVNYVHTQMLGKPFRLRVLQRDGTVVKTYYDCWEQRRCRDKREILEALLKISPGG